MTSLMVPIVVDGRFYGVLGVDMTLDFLQQVTDKAVENNKDLTVGIYSNTGLIAGISRKPELVGKTMSELHSDWESDLGVIQNGTSTVEEDAK